jgi:hypothetical protein
MNAVMDYKLPNEPISLFLKKAGGVGLGSKKTFFSPRPQEFLQTYSWYFSPVLSSVYSVSRKNMVPVLQNVQGLCGVSASRASAAASFAVSFSSASKFLNRLHIWRTLSFTKVTMLKRARKVVMTPARVISHLYSWFGDLTIAVQAGVRNPRLSLNRTFKNSVEHGLAVTASSHKKHFGE